MSKSKKQKKAESSNDNSDVIVIDLKAVALPLSIIISSLIVGISIIIGFNTADFGVTTTSSDNGEATSEDTNNNRGSDNNTNNNNTGNQGDRTYQEVTVSIDDDPILGNRESAQVAIVEFSDYNCGVCTQYHQDLFKNVTREYVDSGNVITVYRDFAGVGGDVTIAASNAAECARAQTNDEVFYELIEEVYNSSGTKNAELVAEVAQGFDQINQDELNSCIEDETYYDEVRADRSDGVAIGVGGTPNFVIGVLQDDGTVDGVLVPGLQREAEFRRIIDSQLARTR
jgi:protein-disulfide isomerase